MTSLTGMCASKIPQSATLQQVSSSTTRCPFATGQVRAVIFSPLNLAEIVRMLSTIRMILALDTLTCIG